MSPPKIQLINNKISEVDHTKFLGLTIDNHLSWDIHIENLSKKLTSGIFALYNMAKICDLNVLKTIYFAYIQSNISFGIQVYGATTKRNLNRILIIQKNAIRTMLNLNWRESVKEQFKDLGFMTVYSMYIYEVLLHIKLNYNHLELVGNTHDYLTRGRNDIKMPLHKLKFFEKKPTVIGIKFYNHLPQSIKNEINFYKFKKALKYYMLTKPLYSIEEFFT